MNSSVLCQPLQEELLTLTKAHGLRHPPLTQGVLQGHIEEMCIGEEIVYFCWLHLLTTASTDTVSEQ